MSPTKRSGLLYVIAYGIALLATVATVALRWGLDPWLGDFLPLATLYGAVGVAVWAGGVGPALLATLLGLLACDVLFMQPRGSLAIADVRDVIGIALYLVASAI